MRDSIRRIVTGPGLIAIGLFVLFQGFNKGGDDALLRKHGSISKGKILEHETRRGRKGSTTYYILARYDGGSGPTTRKFQVSNDYSDSHREGDEIEIRYLSDNPQVAQVVGQESSATAEKVGGGLMIATGLGVTYFWLIRPMLSSG